MINQYSNTYIFFLTVTSFWAACKGDDSARTGTSLSEEADFGSLDSLSVSISWIWSPDKTIELNSTSSFKPANRGRVFKLSIYRKNRMNECMFNDTPTQKTDRLLGVRKRLTQGYIIKN